MERIHLIGVEQVDNAGIRMQHAANDMLRAANMISEALFRHKQDMDEFLDRLDQIMNEGDEEEEEGI